MQFKNGYEEKRFSEMIAISRKFKNCAETDASFRPEYIAAEEINKMIAAIQELKKEDAQKILHILNEVEDSEHCNGTGWLDYKMHISGLLIQNGYEVDWAHSRKMKLR